MQMASGTVDTGHELWGWGNSHTNGGSGYSSPVQIGTKVDWLKIATGVEEAYAAAINAKGELYMWGTGADGKLGLGNTTNYNVPQHLSGNTWSEVSLGRRCSSGITTDGKLWGWGKNTSGQLGQGDTTVRSSPVQMGSATNWVNCYSGYSNTMAINSSGELWGTGYGGQGRRFSTSTATISILAQSGSKSDWITTGGGMGGWDSRSGIDTSGRLWTCGQNYYGSLGQGNNNNVYSAPTQVDSATNWAYADGGNVWMGAVNTAGQLFTAGYHAMGGVTAIGLNTGQANSLVQVGSLTDWGFFDAGYATWFSIKTDGTIWGAGSNQSGILGPRPPVSLSSPVLVATANDWRTVSCGGYGIALALRGGIDPE